MKEKLQKLEENSILILSNWWGLGTPPGRTETIITKDKKVYVYTEYYRKELFLEKNNIPLESLHERCSLTENDYNKITSFIKNEILSKKYEPRRMRDAGYSVSGIYENTSFKYSNYYDINTEKSLYDKTMELIKNISDNYKE